MSTKKIVKKNIKKSRRDGNVRPIMKPTATNCIKEKVIEHMNAGKIVDTSETSIMNDKLTVPEMLKHSDFITQESDGISMITVSTYSTNIDRLKTTMFLFNVMHNMTNAIELEKGIFEYSFVFAHTNNYNYNMVASIYDYKVDDIIKNFSLNPSLLTDIENKNIKTRFIPFMSPSQLNPAKWNTILSKQRLNEERENNVPTTDEYTCRKCGQKKSTIRFLQTRSIDEPMTVFVTCCNCHNTFTV